jgi:hypothetical protein
MIPNYNTQLCTKYDPKKKAKTPKSANPQITQHLWNWPPFYPQKCTLFGISRGDANCFRGTDLFQDNFV